MAEQPNSYLTLADLYKRQQNAGTKQLANIINMMAKVNPIMEDVPILEANSGNTHKTTRTIQLPQVHWKNVAEATEPSKSGTEQVEDGTGLMEAWSEVPDDLVKISADGKKLRLDEAQTFIEAMSQEFARTFFYGSKKTNPKQFDGVFTRFSQLASSGEGAQILDAGGTGLDNTSIFLGVWSERNGHLIYPKGTKAGLERKDMGLKSKDDGGKKLLVWEEMFQQHVGLTIRKPNEFCRIANIDVSDLTRDASSGANLMSLLIDAYYLLNARMHGDARAVIYCNTTVKQFLHHQMINANGNVTMGMDEVAGKEVMKLLEMPIRECEGIINNEAQVTA
ncbi:major capsid protein [Magnetococcus sp. PR-3]|uniref:major capsid protein n=1 Tax=Magnetococcus sp. PR-3 TaxID=3120355 RepID=UPI002FCE48C6